MIPQMQTAEGYQNVALELVGRILDLIPTHPEILTLPDAWGLLKIEGFVCSDLEPTLFQASWAFDKARQLWDQQHE